MTVNEALRAMAGIVVLVTLALGYWVSPYWYLFTAFVGPQPAAVRVHEMVPGDDDLPQARVA